MFTLAVCAEMVFRALPIEARVRRIAELGFQVEIWDWTRHDIDGLVRTGATFSSMTGYVTGDLIDPDGSDELLRTAAQSIPIAKRLGIPRLNLHGTGLDGQGLPVKPIQVVTGAMWLKARDTLARIADLGARHDVMFVLENLNAEVDHPGVPFGRAADCLALVQAVDHPHLRLMLDLYHAQIGEGNLIELLRRAATVYRRDPGRRRAGPLRTRHRRDQLSCRRTGTREHWTTAARSGSRRSPPATTSSPSPASATPSP